MFENEELDDEMIQFEKDHPSKKTSGNTHFSGPASGSGANKAGGGALRTVVIILSVVAAVLLAVLAYVWIKDNRLVKELNIDKEKLTQELVSLQNDYETLSTENTSLTDSLTVEKEKVEQLIDRLKKTDATNRAKMRQYEKELGTLRSIMKSYIHQIDSLNTLNTELRNDAAQARREAQESRQQYEDLRSTTDELSRIATAGAVVKGRGISLTAINNSNKQTDRSSRASKLVTSLSLIENQIADKGYKTVYIRIKGPDGVLMATDSGNTFTCEGEQMIYSACRDVDYQGEEVDISIYFSNPQGFTKGVYTVDVYTADAKIGSADLRLR